jgi:hypothetical protein
MPRLSLENITSPEISSFFHSIATADEPKASTVPPTAVGREAMVTVQQQLEATARVLNNPLNFSTRAVLSLTLAATLEGLKEALQVLLADRREQDALAAVAKVYEVCHR